MPNTKILEGLHLSASPGGAGIITARAGASRMCLSSIIVQKGLAL